MDFDHKYWIMVVSAAMWVFYRHKGKPFIERAVIVLISVGIGLSIGQEVVDWSGVNSPNFITGALIFLGWMVLDVSTSVLSDREGFKKAVWKRLGGE